MKNLIVLLLLVFATVNCASNNSIFPGVPLTNSSDFEIPNPIAVVADTANNQLIIVNSNVDILFDQGSLVTLGVNASNPLNPTFTLTDAIAIPNFAGNVAFDGTFLYIPFREGTDEESQVDQIRQYTVTAGGLVESDAGSTAKDPFGIGIFNNEVLVVNDDELEFFSTTLVSIDTIDLTIAEDLDIENSNSAQVENVAVDNVNNRAFITNRRGNILVIDLDTNELSHVIDGPDNTRGIAFDGNYLYVVDGSPPALWIFDPSQLSDPVSGPDFIDDSTLLVDIVDLGENPNGLAIDTAANRAYVANSTERSVSVIDLNIFQEIERISLRDEDTDFTEGKEPFAVSVGTYNGTTFVFVANFTSNNISVINADTLTVVASYPE